MISNCSLQQRRCWTLKPSLPPPRPSSLLWHSLDYYTVLRRLNPHEQLTADNEEEEGYRQRHHYQLGCSDSSNGVSQTVSSIYSSSVEPSQSNRRIPLPLPPSSPSLLLEDNAESNITSGDSGWLRQATRDDTPGDGDQQGSNGSHSLHDNMDQDIHTGSEVIVQSSDPDDNKLSPPPDGGSFSSSSTTTTTTTYSDQTSGVGKVQTKLKTRKDGSLKLTKECVNCNPPEKITLVGGNQTSAAGVEQSPAWRDVRTMDSESLAATEAVLQSASECAMVLIFTDQSTQFREYKIDGACVAVAGTTGVQRPNLDFFFLPLDPRIPSLDEWCRKNLLQLLGHARVICYEAQEIVTAIINHFSLHDKPDVWLKWEMLDVRLGAWLLDPDHVPDSFHHVLSRFNVSATTTTISAGESEVYNDSVTCQDLSLLGPLMVTIYHRLVEQNLWQLFTEVETPIVPILGAMEANGVRVDTAKLLHFDHLLKLKISQVELSAHKAAKRTFSINSTQQLRQVLFDELQLDQQCTKKLSKTTILKHKSTSESVLLQLQDLHPLPGLVLEYRQLCKVRGTYVAGLLPLLSKEGVLRPCWQQTGTATGRLVSCNPNIQAFPKTPIVLGVVKRQFVVGKTEERESVAVRETVVSRDGYSFVSADFRSIELRLLAHLSEDPVLISILTTQPQTNSNSDVFVHLAAQWLGKSVEEVSGSDREKAKRVVYAIVYGVGKEKLAEILGVSPAAAKELNISFLNRFSLVKSYMQRTVTEARRIEYVETICHRRRWFPQIHSSNPHIRSYSERQAINFPIQGSAADICKCGMIQSVHMLAKESPKTRLLIQIHDELLFEVPDNDVQLVCDNLKAVLESPNLIPSHKLKVPLEVRVTVGQNWSEVSSNNKTMSSD